MMFRIREVLQRMRCLSRGPQLERDVDAELRVHLELSIEENLRRGLSPSEARRQALLRLGGVEQAKERHREARGLPFFEARLQDIRHCLRMLYRSPSFTCTVILTLALGIGANLAIFSIVNGLLLRPLPVPKPEQIVILAYQHEHGGIGNQFSVPEYKDIAGQTSGAFSQVFGYWFGIDGLSVNGNADRIMTNYVTSNFFTALEIRPLLGRFLVAGEGETPNADPVIVLSYEYWRRRFDSDPSVIGKKVLVDGKPITIVGVTPKDFYGISSVLNTQAYLPLNMVTLEGQRSDFAENRTLRSMSIAARLASSETLAQANAALGLVGRRMSQQFPVDEGDVRLIAFPEQQARPNPDPSGTMLVVSGLFLGLAIMILLLACLNITNILLVRAATREGEMAIRAALGAGRSRLVWQSLTESILLTVIGAIAGFIVGRVVNYSISNIGLGSDLLIRLDFSLDWRVFGYAVALTVFTIAVVGLAPAFRASRADINRLLHQAGAGRGVSSRKHRLRSALVVLQVSGSLIMLIIGGLFMRSLKVAERSDLGFDPSHVADISMDPREIGLNDVQGLAFYNALLDRVRMLPGVEAAGLTSSVPLSYYNDADTVTPDNYDGNLSRRPRRAMFSVVSPSFLDTLKITLLRGRAFKESDNADSPFVSIINQAIADRYWPGQDPVGRHFRIGRDPQKLIEVIGVAGNSRVAGVTGNFVPNLFLPLAQHYSSGLTSLQTLVVRVSGDAEAMVPELQLLVRSMEPELPTFDAQPLTRAIDTLNGLLIFKIGALLVGALGGLGLVLSVVGIYGVLSYSVGQRKREIGIRIALGAEPGSIAAMVLRQGALLIGLGLAIGVASALMASRIIANLLTVPASDPLTYIGVTVLLGFVAFVASYLPARRVMRLDPSQSLRYE
jgi:predicted permease